VLEGFERDRQVAIVCNLGTQGSKTTFQVLSSRGSRGYVEMIVLLVADDHLQASAHYTIS
jgi:hypothetical protein